jgi:hypothetical protein
MMLRSASDRRRVGGGLRDDAVEVLAGVVTAQQLALFLVGKAEEQALIDDRAQLRHVVEDLARRLHVVGDHLGRGRVEVELDIGLRLGAAFRHHAGAVREAGFLDVLQRVAVHLALREQVADGHATLRQRQDARQPSVRQRIANGAGCGRSGRGQRGLGGHVDPAALAVGGEEGLDLVVLDELLAEGFDVLLATLAALEHLLLDGGELLGEALVHLGERLVHFGLGGLGDLLAGRGLGEEVGRSDRGSDRPRP